jgi:hypothetical protein
MREDMKDEQQWQTLSEVRALIAKARSSAGGSQPRHPAGSSKGGQFAPKGGAIGASSGAFIGARLGAAAGVAAGAMTGIPGAAKVGMVIGGGVGIEVGSKVGRAVGTLSGAALDIVVPKAKALAASIKEKVPDLDIDVDAMANGVLAAAERIGMSQENFNALQDAVKTSPIGQYMNEANAVRSLRAIGDQETLSMYQGFLDAQKQQTAATYGKMPGEPIGKADTTLDKPKETDETQVFFGAAYAYTQLMQAGLLEAYDATEDATAETAEPTEKRLFADIAKIDDEQRLVYGWASVYEQDGQPVIDKQRDRISEGEVVKMAQRFVTDARVAKALHQSAPVGRVVESLVLTRDIQKSLGIDLGKAGWFVGMKIDDPATWDRVKSGELRTLSIGGKGVRTKTELEVGDATN